MGKVHVMDLEMKKVLELLKSDDLSDRKKAIETLYNWNNVLDLQDSITLLKKASEIRPISDEEWDNPSDALVTAACLFIHKDMIPVIKENIFHYSFSAINKVLTYLLILGTEEAIHLFHKTYKELIFHVRLVPDNEEMFMITEQKESVLTVLKMLMENDAHFHPWYIEYYHFLIAAGIQTDYLTYRDVDLDEDYIVERLSFFIEEYQKYDSDYRIDYVYGAWRETYLHLRFFLINYLTLYNAFCTDEDLLQFNFILNWKDNKIRLHYIETMWQRGLEVDFEILKQILSSDYGPNDAYTLIHKYKPELLPSDPAYQQYFVKEAASFYFLNSSEIYKFPDEIEIMGTFEIEDFYEGSSLTYYVLRFRSNDPSFMHRGWIRMLMGAYYTIHLPTSFHTVDKWDIYTDYKSWAEHSFEEHVEHFQKWLNDKYEHVQEEQEFYSYYPKFDRRSNTVAFLTFFMSFLFLWISDWFFIGLIGAPLWWISRYIYSKRLEKNIFIRLRGYYLDYYCFDEGTYVTLNEIASIAFEKRTLSRPERFLFLPTKKWHYVFYDHDGNELYSIPGYYIEAEFFFPIFKQRTAHLAKKPELKWEKESA